MSVSSRSLLRCVFVPGE
uniref:Uncharacterized protein n=1 Tax=Anguilla anguilla TaxID=7936 RepID=A0A0E9SPF7_ANGAN